MPLNATDAAIGDLLILQRLLSLAQLDEATEIAASCKVRLADIILSQCWMKPSQLYRTLAQHFSLPFLDLAIDPPDGALFEEGLADDYLRHLVVPWRRAGGQLLIATAQPGPETILFARSQWGTAIDFVVASKLDIFRYVQDTLRDSQSERAIHELARADPDMSADHVLTCGQLAAFFALFTGLAAGIAFAPAVTLIALNGFLTLFFVGNFIFRGVLAWIGSREPRRSSLQLEIDARLLREDELPVYTVLVPLFQEPEVLPILAGALRDMDYPVAKLDIKLVVEENDRETIAAAQALGLEGAVELILVPACAPQTKSKACNYALRFALGELLVIYDAEDKPERDQLRKVVAAFRASPPGTACIQCQLNYYNIRENWLTRMFTLEYALWFDLMLPGLERLGLPIPLGGTSNHFKIGVLRELHGWDPFNVTEDADLGIRLMQKGYGVHIITSTTYEEANCRTGNWIRQRSRWIKGYIQTFLVHSRRPVRFIREHGVFSAFGFVLFVGGTILSGLLNPLFWSIFLFWLVSETASLEIAFPPALLCLSLISLLVGNGLFVYLTMIAPFQRGWLDLSPYALTVSWYWLLTSIAAFKGLAQLISNPFYWEKTQHGISRFTAEEVAKTKFAGGAKTL